MKAAAVELMKYTYSLVLVPEVRGHTYRNAPLRLALKADMYVYIWYCT